MKPIDISRLNSVTGPTVSPDGATVVFAVSRPSLAADTYTGQLWQHRVDGAITTRLTRGQLDRAAAFSPDGSMIAFLRSAPGAAPQLQVMRATGSEPIALTDTPLGVGSFDWSPDGGSVVFSARVAQAGRYGTVDGRGAGDEPARRILTAKFRQEELGYTIDRRSQLFVVEIPDLDAEPAVTAVDSTGYTFTCDDAAAPPKAPRQLTTGDYDHDAPRFAADGATVLFAATLHPGSDTDLRGGVYSVPSTAAPLTSATLPEGEGAEQIRTLVAPEANLQLREFLPAADGAVWALASDVGVSGLDFIGRGTALYRAAGAAGETSPSAVPVLSRLTDPAEYDLDGGAAITELTNGDVLVLAVDRGTQPLLQVDIDGTVTALTDGPLEITGHAAAAGLIAVTLTNGSTAGDLALLEDGVLRTVTDFSASLRAAGIAEAQELEITTGDGFPVHGWVLVPEGHGPHPVLLNIHGGPFAQYTGSIFDEAQVYVDAGYAVVMCNPRGAAGYGEEHGRAIRGRMGTVDATDVLDFFEGALEAFPQIDGHRAGIMGGSYGGYLTAWIIAHNHRFAASIVERGFLDPQFFVGTSDIGSWFAEEYTGPTLEQMMEQSPQAVVKSVTTPTLLIHSENDLRCPLPQAERYHLSLLRAGVASELLVFPGEGHNLSRTGRPRHRVQRFESILSWWAKYLPVS
ncbi:MAG: hypothetical protein JWQ43_960 [Glaciihabitans sp.]|nr:hypothetical protein [Glaciihabitans sp.]